MENGTFAPRQTNTGLYLQMHLRGFTNEGLLVVQQAYRLACRLFSGRVRKTERAFICHTVGAASAVAEYSLDPDLVAVAMLHAAYDCGQFPDGRLGGASTAHRAWLTARVGPGVEERVHRYARFSFDAGDPERIAAQDCAREDRDLLFIALAHELDDLMDLGLVFAEKYGSTPIPRIDACVQLATALGEMELAAALRAYEAVYAGDCQWVAPLASSSMKGFTVLPGLRAYARRRVASLMGTSVKIH